MTKIAEIIQECAELRGVGSIPQRSMDEFQHFVMSVLFADELDRFNSDLQDNYYLDRYTDTRDGLMQAFLAHCKDIYDPVKIKQQEIKYHKDCMVRDTEIIEKLERELYHE